MQMLPLRTEGGHLFVEVNDGPWLLDTGAPLSFGDARVLRLAGKQFRIAGNHLGLTATTLSNFVGVPCQGLLGADVLGSFDILLDTPSATVAVSTDELTHVGRPV